MDSKKTIAKKLLLIKRVKEEAKKLREFATPEELGQISLNRLQPNNSGRCIYGQMTGYCFNDRAHELINKCCEKVYSNNLNDSDHRIHINGKLPINIRNRAAASLFSPIEIFIARMEDGRYYPNTHNGNSEALIEYLRGETNELELKLW